MTDRDLFLISTHVEELLATTHAIRQWLRDNQPVRAFEALDKLDEKIKSIKKELDIKVESNG